MSKLTKTLLWLAVGFLTSGLVLVSGLVEIGNLVVLYVALPLGAICFGLYLISQLLEKESARYDQEQGEIRAKLSAPSDERRAARYEAIKAPGSRERVREASTVG